MVYTTDFLFKLQSQRCLSDSDKYTDCSLQTLGDINERSKYIRHLKMPNVRGKNNCSCGKGERNFSGPLDACAKTGISLLHM